MNLYNITLHNGQVLTIRAPNQRLAYKLVPKRYLKAGQASSKKYWKTLTHHGPVFPPDYVPHKTKVRIKKVMKTVTPELEERLTHWAMLHSTDLGRASTKDPVFRRNFWKDCKKLAQQDNLQSLDDVDVSTIVMYLQNKPKAERVKKEKPQNAFALVDGQEQAISNYSIEPPGIFKGRGKHPLRGRWKRRITPKDVILNTSGKVPQAKAWKDVVCDRSARWLAAWQDPVQGKRTKYMYLAADSGFKQASDRAKFDTAKKLAQKINKVRKIYRSWLDDPDTRQLGLATWFIDHLALRAGNEKNTKLEADTVGVTSLRVEHVKKCTTSTLQLSFLGKDSVPFCKSTPAPKYVVDAVQQCMKHKKPKDQLFDQLSTKQLNEALHKLVPNLTSKSFRTMHASQTMQDELDKIKIKNIEGPAALRVLLEKIKVANSEVAKLCNHKNMAKASNSAVDQRLKEQIQKAQQVAQEKKTKVAKDRLQALKMRAKTRKLTKQVSLGTSKNNYIDPRILIAFAKTHDIPPEKIYSKTLLAKFAWALDTPNTFRW